MRPPPRAALPALAALAVSAACSSPDTSVAPPAPDPCTRTDLDTPPPVVPHTARWAFEPWISKDISDRADTYAFVDGFRDRGIPVGAVVLDSPWETSYNTFVPNPSRYGDFPALVSDMHARGVRVVLWITAYVNEASFDFEPGGDVYPGVAPNLQEGLDCHYFVDDGASFVWWKGRGASLDFFHPSARAWWHRQQDVVLDAGIDGWKLDFGESYIGEPTVKTHDGEVPLQTYSEKYYEDFLAYGRQKRGPEFLTMTRAWDASYDFPGRFFAKKEHSPVSWMGDNRRDYVGLADALDESFVSARAGYVVVGSDIGGYLDHDDKNLLGPAIPLDTEVLARWTAVGALSPFMQLHGRANLTPWTVPDHADETVALYKYWATLHHALVPFFYSLAEDAHESGGSIVKPIGEPASWPGDYRYTLGDALLVAPILDASGKRDVPLPAGARYYDWWTGVAAEGGTTARADFSQDRAKIPLYVREGAIVPMTVDGDELGLGPASPGALTLLLYPSATASTFRLREDDDSVTTVTLAATAGGASAKVSKAPKPLVLRFRSDADVGSVTASGAALARAADEAALAAAGSGFAYDAAAKTLVVRLPAKADGYEVATAP